MDRFNSMIDADSNSGYEGERNAHTQESHLGRDHVFEESSDSAPLKIDDSAAELAALATITVVKEQVIDSVCEACSSPDAISVDALADKVAAEFIKNHVPGLRDRIAKAMRAMWPTVTQNAVTDVA